MAHMLQGALKGAIATSRSLCGMCCKTRPLEPSVEVMDLLISLKMTQRHVEQLYDTFMQLKRHDPLTVKSGPNEVSTGSLSKLVTHKREWVENLLVDLVAIGGFGETLTWDGFLYILIRYCTLSKIELCQVQFFCIVKAVRGWTVNCLTCAQLQEFYDLYSDCPVKSFSTGDIKFDNLPLSKYSMIDFIELVHRYSQLIGPAIHLQRSLQQALPSFSFWEDYDRVKVLNRKITIEFFQCTKSSSFYQVVLGGIAHGVKDHNTGSVGSKVSDNIDEDPSMAAALLTQEIEKRHGRARGDDLNAVVDVLNPPGSLPLPSDPMRPKRWKPPAPVPVPAWMEAQIKGNEDPVTGTALGSAAAKPSPRGAQRALLMPPPRFGELAGVTKSVDAAKAAIERSIGPRMVAKRAQYYQRLAAEKQADAAAEKLRGLVRASQLEYILRARNVRPSNISVLEVMERVSTAELIG